MPETYGMPDPTEEVPIADRIAEVIAGQGIVRRIVLYAIVAASLVLAFFVPVLPVAVGYIALLMLLATDRSLT